MSAKHDPIDAPHADTTVRTTTCSMCACRCGILVQMREGADGPEVRYIEGNPDHPPNRGPGRARHPAADFGDPMTYDQELDASGLACPLPIARTVKSLKAMTSGQVLRVVATDPGSVSDMAAFAEQTGHALLHSGEEGGKYVFLIRKS